MARHKTYRSCSIVGGVGCKAPANLDGPPMEPLTTCYRCGEDICRDPGCSLLVKSTQPIGSGQVRTRRKVRMCWYCAEHEVGTEEVRRMAAEAYDRMEPTP